MLNKPYIVKFLVIFAVMQLIVCVIALAQSSVSGKNSEIGIRISKEDLNDIQLVSTGEDEYQIETTGSDPYLFTEKLEEAVSREYYMLSFDYFCPTWLDHLQIFFAAPVDENKSIHSELGVAEGWKTFSIDVKEFLDGWGNKDNFLRLDFGSAPNYKMQIRNIRFRKPTQKERELAANREKNKVRDAQLAQKLDQYLNQNFPSAVTHVLVDQDEVTISGTTDRNAELYLAEVPLYEDITELSSFAATIKIPYDNNNFKIKVNRFVASGRQKYDRLLSKWAVVDKKGNKFSLASHARYADSITPKHNLPDEKPWNKKGIGGFHSGGHAPVEDLDSLQISSVTVNIWITQFIRSKPSETTMPFTFNDKTYYVEKKAVESLDNTLKLTARKNIIVSAILLVGKAVSTSDKEIGRIFEHPDCDPAGIYSMANVTSAEGLEYYAAIVDFLAQRYSMPDKRHGRIHHWIIHNEVDAGWVWTNMGEKPPLLFMDDYVKSMRTVYNIGRKYNANAKVFISLTHYWTWTSDRHYYYPKELMEILLQYSKQEGDFEWAIAQHPYPESLFEPKSWLDQKCDFTFNTPLITYKNIEVLDAWVKRPETYYLGKYRRVIHLSEQGTNSMDYTEKSLQEQAAGMAYAWKKIKDLESIEAFQYHNWMDHRGEGGLRIGLRRFPDDKDDPAGKKPIWYVFRDMGTVKEDHSFAFAKKIIGIDQWDEVNFKGEIDPEKRGKTMRDLKSDAWKAIDNLGRRLPGFEEAGPVKKEKTVGMFYFLTHNTPGVDGPYDVGKIKAANPDNPAWGNGTHYWGEPELGYYQSTDRWVIRRHAEMLSDAGVDVIIFDCTNNVTYAEVTKTIFEVFREMRAQGEPTPYIAYLASESSVHQIWDQIYSKGLYADLWFHWKGKPLLLFGQWAGIRPMNEVKFPSHIQKFFSIRNSWAWTTLPWYKNNGKDMWPWVDHYPQHVGWHESREQAEYVPVAVAQHPLSNIGRSYQNGKQPPLNQFDLTPLTGKGLHFDEQWKRAIDVDPEFVFVTGWNEWTAGRQTMNNDIEKSLKVWDFYPGANLGKVGRPLKPGDVYFIDQYNQEYSRDIEPMNGGHGDNYYYQLIANIRRYKGIRRPEAPLSKTIDIDKGFDQWDDSLATYYDHIGDATHRNSAGNFKAGPYVNTSGRNDILETKVTHNDDYFYFYVKYAAPIISPQENFMMIFINTDPNKSTGWRGYDYVLDGTLEGVSETRLKKLTGKGRLKKRFNVPIRIEGEKLMIRVPRARIKMLDSLNFEFHIVDNGGIDNTVRFFLNGDHAPSRRANYSYGR